MVVVSFICMMMSEMNVRLDDTVGIAAVSVLNFSTLNRLVGVVQD